MHRREVSAQTSVLLRPLPSLPLAVQGHHEGGEGAAGVPGPPGGWCHGLEEQDHCRAEV